jgi:hypothetical protein
MKRIANRSGCGNVSMVTALLERIWKEDGNGQEDGLDKLFRIRME